MHTYNELCDTWRSQDEVHIHDVKMTGDLPGSGRQHVYIYIYILLSCCNKKRRFIIDDATYQWEKHHTETIY